MMLIIVGGTPKVHHLDVGVLECALITFLETVSRRKLSGERGLFPWALQSPGQFLYCPYINNHTTWFCGPGSQTSQPVHGPRTHHLRVILDNIVRLDKQDILRLQICVREFIVVQD